MAFFVFLMPMSKVWTAVRRVCMKYQNVLPAPCRGTLHHSESRWENFETAKWQTVPICRVTKSKILATALKIEVSRVVFSSLGGQIYEWEFLFIGKPFHVHEQMSRGGHLQIKTSNRYQFGTRFDVFPSE